MKRAEMMRRPVVSFALLWALLGVFAPTSALPTDMSDIDTDRPRRAEAPLASPLADSPPASAPGAEAVKPQEAPSAPERTSSANPLWAIPLTALSNTRGRPVFSSSRRPPPPVFAPAPEVKAPPPPPKSPPAERPQLSLIGTIASGDQSFGIFIDQATKAALRLKVGEDFQGWQLQSVQGREATFGRDQQTTILSLPQPDAGEDGQSRVQAETEVTQGSPLNFQPQRGLR